MSAGSGTLADGEYVQETLPGHQLEVAGRTGRWHRPGPDSLAWLILVAVLFFASELVPELLRLPLGADEITYIAATSVHHSGVFLPPVHGHGAGLLAAPVTLLTTSLLALRLWMALLSALGLFGSLLCWWRLRPAWVLAVAGFLFGGLAITQLSGVQVYPDLWAGFGALAITGLVLQTVQGRLCPRLTLPLIAFAAFVIVLMRPQNAVFVLVPTFVVPLLVRAWRKPAMLIAIVIGTAAGGLDWIAEAYLWFGGLANRIHLAAAEPPKFGLTFSLPMQIKTLSGPWYCQPRPYGVCTAGYSYPESYLWWLAFFALVAIGLVAGWRLPSRSSALFALVTGAWVAILYVLFVPFGAPRYFLPTWALLAIVAADGIARLVSVPNRKKTGIALAAVFLVSWAISQHFVLGGEVANQLGSRRAYVRQAAALSKLGIRAPCAIALPSPAYYLGCTAPWTGGRMHQVLTLTPGGAAGWRELKLPPGAPFRTVWVRR